MSTSRTVIEVGLKPLAGSLFQATGFPDLGAAEFGDGNLLVESAQSMANWLEGTTWDSARSEPAAELAALPYVRVVSPDGEYLTSSRVEAHRLACAYIMDGTIDGTSGPKGRDWLPPQLGLVKGRPLDNRAVARACFRLDPVSLIHGVFFAQKAWPWQPKIARALTSFIEASGIQPAVSGGVKRDSVLNEGKGFTDRGYGSIPHHRVEYTAKEITAYFAVDHAQFRSYGLSEPATALLEALADFEIATLLDGGLRLRTRCDLVPDAVKRGEIPDAAEAAQRIAKFATDCAEELGQVTTVTWLERPAK
jgi:CRISPR-associated protein Csb1